jgi:hypothetical protein
MIRSVIAFTAASAVGLGAVSETGTTSEDGNFARLARTAGVVFTIAHEVSRSGGESPSLSAPVKVAAAPAYAFAVPAACIFKASGHFGPELVADAACVGEIYVQTGALPVFCEKGVSTQAGKDRVFDLDCLSRWGFSVEAAG